MKAEEIMIGDWVLLDTNYSEENPMYTQPNYQPYRIQNGDCIDFACETNCIGDADVYQPIPLTAEIMLNNKFEKFRFLKDFYCIDGNKCLYTDCKEVGIWTRNIAGDWEWFAIGECKYVHELQHALRLCGIEKEIEL